MPAIFIFLMLLATCFVGQAQSLPAEDSLKNLLTSEKNNKPAITIRLKLADAIYKSDPYAALGYVNEVIDYSGKSGNDSLLTAAYRIEGNTYLHLGNYSRAMKDYQKVIQGAERMDDLYAFSAAYGNLGSISYYQKNYVQALKYYKQALDHLDYAVKHPGNESRKANLLNNIGIIYDETKRYKEAGHYYQKALELAIKLNDAEIRGNVLNNLGTLQRDLKNNTLALNYYQQALALRRKAKNKFGIARSYANIGQFYFEHRNNSKTAEKYFKDAIILGQGIGAWETVRTASSFLYELFKRKGDYKNALHTLELNRQVSDSLYNAENTRKIAQLEMQFDFDRKQNLVESNQKERELYLSMSAGGTMLLLIIVTLLFFLQRAKTRQSKLEQSHLVLERVGLKNNILQKDKELAANIMYLLNKNELINQISEKLTAIKGDVGAPAQNAVQKVVLDLRANLQPQLWQEFELRFQQVHEQFYKNLNEKFPDLTTNERRLCVFLRLNMSTKEISAITHQNAKSIDVARTRLRKKLNLTGTDQNLVAFLSRLDNLKNES